MKSSQVRELARRYATGKLSQESYRSQRRSLIESITAGQVPLIYRQEERAAKRPRFNTKLLGLVMAAVAVAGVCTALFLHRSAKLHASAQAGTASVAGPVAPPAPGQALVQQFLDADDWSDGSLENFEQRWDGLGGEEQAKAKDNPTYPRLMSAIQLQITSEKAVAGDDAAKDPHLAQLQKLAKTLGVSAGL